MYGGRIVEQGTLDELFYDPQHPYTWGLLGLDPARRRRPLGAAAGDPGHAAVAAGAAAGLPLPRRAARTRSTSARRSRRSSSGCPTRPDHLDRCWLSPDEKRALREVDGRIGLVGAGGADAHERRRRRALLEADHLQVLFPVRSRQLFGGTVGLRPRRRRRLADAERGRDARRRRRVGLRQEHADPHAGAADRLDRRRDALPRPGHHEGRSQGSCGPVRRELQMVFQDPQASLNPRKRVGQILGTPLRLRGVAKDDVTRRDARAARRRSGSTPSTSTASRTSSPAASASASASPARWPSSPKVDHARRAGLGARRVDPGAGRQPARGPAGRRSGSPTCSSPTTCRSCATSRDRIAVMYLGKVVELSPARGALRQADPPVHAGAAQRDPDPGPAARTAPRDADASSAASRPTRSTRRPAAASTPAARTRPTSAGPSSRRWPSTPAGTSRPAITRAT